MSVRKPRIVRQNPPRPTKDADMLGPADFTDPESSRVLDAIADALIGHLAVHRRARITSNGSPAKGDRDDVARVPLREVLDGLAE
jgi:hypothetical protein